MKKFSGNRIQKQTSIAFKILMKYTYRDLEKTGSTRLTIRILLEKSENVLKILESQGILNVLNQTRLKNGC